MTKTEKKEILAKIKEIKDRGFLPYGYAKTVANDILQGTVTDGKVRKVASGMLYDADVVDALLGLAQESKIKNQLSKANDILS